MQPSQRRLSLAVLLALVLMALPAARPTYAQAITVANTTDIDDNVVDGCGADGCSLREAIRLANERPGANTIGFSITGTIAVGSALPDIIDDGTTINAGTSHNVVIDGSAVSVANGLTIRSSNNTIRGLVIIGFRNTGDNFSSGAGIYINGREFGGNPAGGDSNQIYGNWIGVDSTGTTARDNDGYGVFISNGASNNTIGADNATDRNVIAGNLAGGVRINNVAASQLLNQGNSIVGNYIGINATGDGLLTAVDTDRAEAGVIVSNGSRDTLVSNNVIGGFTSTTAGSISAGINVTGYDSSDPLSFYIPTNTTITGNYIGVNPAGTRLANRIGIRMGGDSKFGPKNTIIGTTESGGRNIIAGNAFRGIDLPDTNFTWGDATIAGNYIGLDDDGNPMPNGWGVEQSTGQGIYIGLTQPVVSPAVPIGKITVGPGNVISANATYGIWARTGGHVIKGNLFGTNLAGTSSSVGVTANGGANIYLENGEGVLVGGPSPSDRNIIAYSNSVVGSFSGGILINPVVVASNCNGVCVSRNHTIQNNYIGVGVDGATPLNTTYITESALLPTGMRLWQTEGNTIRGNLIGGLYRGITLGFSTAGSDANNNLIVDNKIGAPASGEIFFASRPTAAQILNAAPRNRYEGIRVFRGTGNTIRSNLVAYNSMDVPGGFTLSAGIWVGLAATAGSASNNTVEDNRLVRNGEFNAFGIVVDQSNGVRLSRNTTQFHDDAGMYTDNGIFLSGTANGNRAAPTGLAIVAGSPPHVTGNSTCNDCTVEIFTTSSLSEANASEGPIYITSGTTSASTGAFDIAVPACQQYLTATVTDASGNSSPYSSRLDTGNPGPCVPLSFTLGAASPNSRNVAPGSTGVYTHTLSHTSPVTISYTVVFTSSNDWASAPALVTVPPNSQTDFVVSVRVPPEALATDPADVTSVQVYAGLQGSNVVIDTTTPAPVTTTPAQPAVSGPLSLPREGPTVTFNHVVTNTGDVTGTFLVSTPAFVGATPSGWTMGSVTPSSFTLGPQVTRTLDIVVNTPTLPPSTDPVTLSFQVSVQGASPPRSVTQIDTITVPVQRSFSFAPTASEALSTTAGTELSFTYTLTNTGNAADSFSVAASPTTPLASPAITSTIVSAPALSGLAPGASAAVTVTYSVPALTTAQAYTATISAQATGGTNPPLAQDRTVTMTVIPIVRSFSFAPTASEVITTPAGANIAFTYALTNTGNAADSFSVAASPTTPLASPAITPTVASAPALSGLAPGASAVVTVTYSVPSFTTAQAYTATISAQATGGASPPAAPARDVTINVTGGGAVVIAPGLPSLDPVTPGGAAVSVTFTNTVTNTGNANAPVAVGLTATLPVSWTAQILTPGTTCPISPTTSVLASGASCTFIVEAVVPAGSPPVAVDLTVTATAYNSPPAVPDVTATAINRVNVGVWRSLELGPTGLTGTGVEGQVITFTHTLTNTGNAADNFDLAVTQSDSRWTTTVSPTVATGLAVGIPRTVEVRSVAGAGIVGGATNVITLTATGQGGGPSKSVTDTLTLTSVSGGDLSPGGRSNVDPGEVAGYSFTVTNTGTAAISYTVSLQNSDPSWNAAASGVPTAVLQPGVTATLTVSVTAPLSAAPGVTNTTTVRLLVGDGSGAPLDTAEVVTGIGPRLGVMLTPANGSAAGPPGSTVAITHTLTNLGSEAGDFRLFIDDVVGWPATVTPDLVTLAPGASVVVTVRVRIQDSARAGDVNFVAVGAELVGDPTVNAQAIERLTVTRVIGLNLSASQARSVLPGETVSLSNLSLLNSGSDFDTYTLVVTGESGGWDVILGQSSVGVDKGDPASISVRVKVPATLVSGTVKVLRIEARSNSDSSVRDIIQLSMAYVVSPTPPRSMMYLPQIMR